MFNPLPLLASAALLLLTLSGCLGGEEAAGSGAASLRHPPLAPGAPGHFVADGDAEQVLWRFGDGNLSREPAAAHAYPSPGLYRVDLETVDADGVRSLASRIVAVGTPAAEPLALRVEEHPLGTHLTMDIEADDHAWELGDGTVATGPGLVHAYRTAGPHLVTAYALVDGVVRTGQATVEPGVVVEPVVSPTGVAGAEPTVGGTSSGCIFVISDPGVLRSCDDAATWDATMGPLDAPPYNVDPFLWVDPVTDRVFSVQLLDMATCTWISWSDDDGASWTSNPWDCGALPFIDHQKLATGAWTATGLSLNPVYPQAVYLCYNKVAGAWCHTSLDGGATFPAGRYVGMADSVTLGVAGQQVGVGGLHGPIATAPDGTVYVPVETRRPSVSVSTDNGLTWELVAFDTDAEFPDERPEPHVAVDGAGHVYYLHAGADNRAHVLRSPDGRSWDGQAVLVSDQVRSVALPAMAAGDAGAVVVAYLGTTDTDLMAGDAPDDTRWYPYVSYATDAMAPEPTWVTLRVWDDPVQVGSVCVTYCTDDPREDFDPDDPLAVGTSNANLLDFIGVGFDARGRALVSFADGCTSACATDLAATPAMSRDDETVVALLTGPSFRTA